MVSRLHESVMALDYDAIRIIILPPRRTKCFVISISRKRKPEALIPNVDLVAIDIIFTDDRPLFIEYST